jgi:N-acetylmuramic acid 6-phosphate etherase
MMRGELIAGVDGGGSKTLALVARPDGEVLGRGLAGGSNYIANGVESACEALDEALGQAIQAAGSSPEKIKTICLGLGGADRPEAQEIFHEWADRRFPGAGVEILTDAHLVLAAGTPDGWGVALIAGTGSIAWGRTPDGRMARCGGWGYLLGDEGSGYAIGLASLRAIARAFDGRADPTLLTELAMGHWSLTSVPDLVRQVHTPGQGNSGIAAFAELVELAEVRGDAVAQTIFRQAGDDLAQLVEKVIGSLGLAAPVPCALAGSMLVKGTALRQSFSVSARELNLELHPLIEVDEPAGGAILRARELARKR